MDRDHDEDPSLPDDLELDESEPAVGPSTDAPSSVDGGGDNGERDAKADAGLDAADAEPGGARDRTSDDDAVGDDVGGEGGQEDAAQKDAGREKEQETDQAARDVCEEPAASCWLLRALPFLGGAQLARARGRLRPVGRQIWRLAQNPLGLVVVGVVGVALVMVWDSPSPRRQNAAPPAVRSAGFPTVDYRTARRGAITDRQADAILAHYGRQDDTDAAGAVDEREMGDDVGASAHASKPATGDFGGPAAAPDAERAPGAHHQTETSAVSSQQSVDPESRGSRVRGFAVRKATRARRAQALPAHTGDGDTDNDEQDADVLPAYLFDSSDDDEEPEPEEQEKLQLSAGMRIPAVLDLGISSARHGTVVARTTEKMTDEAGLVIPKGSVLTGRSSSGHNRIYVEMTGVRVGLKQYRLRGVVTRGSELGLEAERVETPLEDRTSARVADGALGVLKGLATVAGGYAGRAISETAGGAIDEVQRDQRIDRAVTLKVPAGTTFILVITG